MTMQGTFNKGQALEAWAIKQNLYLIQGENGCKITLEGAFGRKGVPKLENTFAKTERQCLGVKQQ